MNNLNITMETMNLSDEQLKQSLPICLTCGYRLGKKDCEVIGYKYKHRFEVKVVCTTCEETLVIEIVTGSIAEDYLEQRGPIELKEVTEIKKVLFKKKTKTLHKLIYPCETTGT